MITLTTEQLKERAEEHYNTAYNTWRNSLQPFKEIFIDAMLDFHKEMSEEKSDAVAFEQLLSDLEDKRMTKVMEVLDEKNQMKLISKGASMLEIVLKREHQDMYYLSRKHTAEFLLDKYQIFKKETSSL